MLILFLKLFFSNGTNSRPRWLTPFNRHNLTKMTIVLCLLHEIPKTINLQRTTTCQQRPVFCFQSWMVLATRFYWRTYLLLSSSSRSDFCQFYFWMFNVIHSYLCIKQSVCNQNRKSQSLSVYWYVHIDNTLIVYYWT